MTREEKKAYARGYNAGSRRAWPEYHPPRPPDAIAAEIIGSAKRLADKVADWCGAFGDKDEFTQQMLPLMQAVDVANSKLSQWLKSSDRDGADDE